MTAFSPRVPPLLGDGHGQYRVHVVGNSGSGKSTTAATLAKMLGVPYISMDRLLFDPGWVQSTPEQFRAKLRAALDACPQGWVADGNYTKMGGDTAMAESTDVIWLDPPLYVYFPRILLRTFLRLFRLTEPCSPGCYERFSEVFLSRQSILWWCLSHHWITRNRYTERMKVIGIEGGDVTEGRKMRRFTGWGSDVTAWLTDVAFMVNSKKHT